MRAFRTSILSLLATGLFHTYAQDVITLKSGEEIKGKVEEISSIEIRYKRFENLTGPTIVIEKDRVFFIKYENGIREIISPFEEVKTSEQEQIKTEQAVVKSVTTKTNSVSDRKGKVGIGVSPVTSMNRNLINLGFCGKLGVGIANPIRLEGSFVYYLPRTIPFWGFDIKFNIWEANLNVQTIFTKGDKFLPYSSLGLGISGVKVTVSTESERVSGNRSASASKTFAGMNVGAGFDVKLSKKLFFNTEVKTLIAFKKINLDSKAEMGSRFMFSAGLIFRF